MSGPITARLAAERIGVGYGRRSVLEELDLFLPEGAFTVIAGPNACGKSTLLKALARVLPVSAGAVLLDGRALTSLPTRDVARTVGFLPQDGSIPDAMTVRDLVALGRYPHQRALHRITPEDRAAIDRAMAGTGVIDLADRTVDELSGGQRQRAWLAMVLAQETSVLLLDEPTTFLDLAHQLEVLDLCADLQRRGLTVVAVLHDLNQASRYADHLVLMSAGRVVAEGAPADIVTPETVQSVFGVPCEVITDPQTGTPLVIPLAGHRHTTRRPHR